MIVGTLSDLIEIERLAPKSGHSSFPRKAAPSLYPDPDRRPSLEPDSEEPSAAEHFSRQCRRSWARLLRKVYEVDALECPQCGCRLRIIAVIEQRSVIQQILQHLDLWEPPQRAPPPRLFPPKLESFLASLSPQQAQAVRASSDALFWDDVPIWED